MSLDYDEGEYPAIWRESEPMARKGHRCDACGETITPGQRYSSTFYVYDGAAQTIKRCARCETIYRHLLAVRGEWEIIDAELSCGHEYVSHRGVEPPPEIAALAFALPGEVSLEANP